MMRKSKRSLSSDELQSGSTVVGRMVDASAMGEIRRYELGVEALSELAAETVPMLGTGDYHRQPALMMRLAGISMSAWGEEVPHDMTQWVYPVRWSMFLWMSLSRILELTEHLAVRRPKAQWQQVHDAITAWRDSWGDDHRALDAEARFSTITGLTRGTESRVAFLHTSLVKMLSGVQA